MRPFADDQCHRRCLHRGLGCQCLSGAEIGVFNTGDVLHAIGYHVTLTARSVAP
jgi:hypothetical protein